MKSSVRKHQPMNWKRISMVCAGVLAVSLTVNILWLSGCFGPEKFVREKDSLIEHFAKQIKELEAENSRFKDSLARLEEKLEEYGRTHAWAAQELDRILSEYNRLAPP